VAQTTQTQAPKESFEEDYKGIMKDTWQMLWKFFKRARDAPDIEKWYSESDAWPLMLDDFVDWLKTAKK
jgi:hypothetical protein